jgi:hypothetical protein
MQLRVIFDFTFVSDLGAKQEHKHHLQVFGMLSIGYEKLNSQLNTSTYEQTTRPFQGQAPYFVNFILAYDNSKIGLESALYFNVSGNRLYNIALFATPDIYENARPTLNYKISKTFGKYFSVSFAARNLINPEHNRIQTHRGQDFYAERYRLGRTFVVGLGYKF